MSKRCKTKQWIATFLRNGIIIMEEQEKPDKGFAQYVNNKQGEK